jgi:death-on-curing protein
MKEPVWIEKTDCLGFHSALIARFGGLDGIRDEGLLESALNRPLQLFHYENPGHFDLAASYAFGIIKNHPFLDGNKRSGLMAAAMFLELNGWSFHPPEEQAVLRTLALAAGEIGAEEYAAWLRESCSAVASES